MSKQVTFTMGLSDAMMLVTCISAYLEEMTESGRADSVEALMILNPIKRVYTEMINNLSAKATAEEIEAAGDETDTLYFNF